MQTLTHDIRVALRNLRRRPGFGLTVVITMALGIGINTAMFSIVHQTLVRPLPYPSPERLTYIWKDLLTAGYERAPLAPPEIADLMGAATLYERVGGIWATSATLVGSGQPAPIAVGEVTTDFLAVLGVRPIRGRWFTEDDGKPNAPATVVISGTLWQSRFGGADIIGRRIRIDGGFGLWGGDHTVVGVMPVDFEVLLPPASRVPRAIDAWIPLQMDLATTPRNPSYLSTVARLAPGATFASAQEQIDGLNRTPPYARASLRLGAVLLHDELVAKVRPALIVLQAAVAVVILIACGGVAGLALVRAQERRREIGLRAALGGSRRRLAGLVLTESIVLAAAGGLLGGTLSYVALRLLPLIDGGALPLRIEPHLSGPALAVSATACLVPCVLFGLAPLLQSSADLASAVKAGARGTVSPSSQRAQRVLVLAQIVASVALLIATGLLTRSFRNLQAVDPGYRSAHVATFRLPVPPERYAGVADLAWFSRDLERELGEIPSVDAVGVANQLPLDESIGNGSTGYRTRGTEHEAGMRIADARFVTPGYFRTLQASLVAGRWFTDQDDENHPLVLIVDELMARKTWPGKSPLGEELRVWARGERGNGMRWGRVVGVVRHIRHHQLSSEVREQVFMPFPQAPRNQVSVVVRFRGDLQELRRAIGAQLAHIDPNIAPAHFGLLDSYVDRARAPARLNTLVATLFGGMSLLLACVSLYGLIAYWITQRLPELLVRAALGARSSDLIRLVVGQGIVLIVAGVGLGIIASFATMGGLRSLLFGIAPLDPAIFAGAAALVGVVALMACYIPARRAASIDPAHALRSE